MDDTTYTDINGYTSETFSSPSKQAQRIAHRQAVLALRRLAQAEFDRVSSETFRMLARERGGVTPRTREGIVNESRLAGRAAAETIFLVRGYTRCTDPFGGGCTRLASPGYGSCPFCTLKD